MVSFREYPWIEVVSSFPGTITSINDGKELQQGSSFRMQFLNSDVRRERSFILKLQSY
jgi:hypothetical protein